MPLGKNQALATYRQLLEKVEQKFNEIHDRNLTRMNCGKGCHSCCVPDLTVFAIERENLKNLIESTPGLSDELRDLEALNPHQDQRCRFLRADGACAVYEARPLVCRSHGAPLFFKNEGQTQLDVCPLNFDELESLTTLANTDFINLDLLNTMLASLNKELGATGIRYSLQIDAILKN